MGVRLFRMILVCVLLDDRHRIIDVRAFGVRLVERVGGIAGDDDEVLSRRGVEGVKLGIGGIGVQQVHGAVHLHIAVGARVVAQLHIVLARVGAVQLGAAEVEDGVDHLAVHVARGVRRRVIDVVAVDVDAGSVIFGNDQLRDDDIRLGIVARREVVRMDARERALDDVAERVVGGVALRAVDEVEPLIFFDDEAAVGLRGAVARRIAVERVGFIRVAACEHAQRQRQGQQQQQYLFARFQHIKETPWSLDFFGGRAGIPHSPHFFGFLPIYFFIIYQIARLGN